MQLSKFCVFLQTTAMRHTGSIFSGYTIRLGRKRRNITPSCVVSVIQKEFPEGDRNHTGFKDPTVTKVDLAFF